MKNEAIKKDWEGLYKKRIQQHKNKYPNSEVISFILRKYGKYNKDQRKKIKVLDLGCGWGNNLSFLKKEHFDSYGFDGSRTAIEQCKRFTDKVKAGLFNRLPYENDFFDIIVDRNSLQCNNKKNMEQATGEIYRVLRPGGTFFSIILAQTSQPERFHAKYLKSKYSKLTKKELRCLFNKFRDITFDYIKESFDNKRLTIFNWKLIIRK